MAYISTEEVKAIRDEIKKQFPSKEGWKFSVRREHYSTVNVAILQAPIDLDIKEFRSYEDRAYYSVNTCWVKDHFSEYEEAKEAFCRIGDIVENVKKYEDRNAGDPSADYGDSNYFYNLSVGEWNKPFTYCKK